MSTSPTSSPLIELHVQDLLNDWESKIKDGNQKSTAALKSYWKNSPLQEERLEQMMSKVDTMIEKIKRDVREKAKDRNHDYFWSSSLIDQIIREVITSFASQGLIGIDHMHHNSFWKMNRNMIQNKPNDESWSFWEDCFKNRHKTVDHWKRRTWGDELKDPWIREWHDNVQTLLKETESIDHGVNLKDQSLWKDWVEPKIQPWNTLSHSLGWLHHLEDPGAVRDERSKRFKNWIERCKNQSDGGKMITTKAGWNWLEDRREENKNAGKEVNYRWEFEWLSKDGVWHAQLLGMNDLYSWWNERWRVEALFGSNVFYALNLDSFRYENNEDTKKEILTRIAKELKMSPQQLQSLPIQEIQSKIKVILDKKIRIRKILDRTQKVWQGQSKIMKMESEDRVMTSQAAEEFLEHWAMIAKQSLRELDAEVAAELWFMMVDKETRATLKPKSNPSKTMSSEGTQSSNSVPSNPMVDSIFVVIDWASQETLALATRREREKKAQEMMGIEASHWDDWRAIRDARNQGQYEPQEVISLMLEGLWLSEQEGMMAMTQEAMATMDLKRDWKDDWMQRILKQQEHWEIDGVQLTRQTSKQAMKKQAKLRRWQVEELLQVEESGFSRWMQAVQNDPIWAHWGEQELALVRAESTQSKEAVAAQREDFKKEQIKVWEEWWKRWEAVQCEYLESVNPKEWQRAQGLWAQQSEDQEEREKDKKGAQGIEEDLKMKQERQAIEERIERELLLGAYGKWVNDGRWSWAEDSEERIAGVKRAQESLIKMGLMKGGWKKMQSKVQLKAMMKYAGASEFDFKNLEHKVSQQVKLELQELGIKNETQDQDGGRREYWGESANQAWVMKGWNLKPTIRNAFQCNPSNDTKWVQEWFKDCMNAAAQYGWSEEVLKFASHESLLVWIEYEDGPWLYSGDPIDCKIAWAGKRNEWEDLKSGYAKEIEAKAKRRGMIIHEWISLGMQRAGFKPDGPLNDGKVFEEIKTMVGEMKDVQQWRQGFDFFTRLDEKNPVRSALRWHQEMVHEQEQRDLQELDDTCFETAWSRLLKDRVSLKESTRDSDPKGAMKSDAMTEVSLIGAIRRYQKEVWMKTYRGGFKSWLDENSERGARNPQEPKDREESRALKSVETGIMKGEINGLSEKESELKKQWDEKMRRLSQDVHWEVLDSDRKIAKEGQRMHHCVGGEHYRKQARSGSMLIGHLHNKKTMASSTLSFSGGNAIEMLQHKGKYNATVKDELLLEAQEDLQEILKLEVAFQEWKRSWEQEQEKKEIKKRLKNH